MTDSTPYAMKENTLQALQEIEDEAAYVCNWSSIDYFVANPNKSHVLLTSMMNLDNLIIKTASLKKYWV